MVIYDHAKCTEFLVFLSKINSLLVVDLVADEEITEIKINYKYVTQHTSRISRFNFKFRY